MKDNSGRGGKNIYLCNNLDELKKIKEENKELDFIIEEYIGKNDGVAVDYRAYLINFEPKLFIKRTNEGITSNVSRGGTVEIVEPMLEKESIEINKAIPLNVTAIDFTIDKNGDLKIFELNASPGVKALYINDIDAYRPFMKWYADYIK